MTSEWEESFHRANELLSAGRGDDARALLRDAREVNLQRGNKKIAAFYSNVLGSFFSIARKHDEALEAYRAAIRYEPENPHWKLTLAEHLLAVQSLPEEALIVASQALTTIPTSNAAVYHAAHSLLGLVNLELGRAESAWQSFLKATAPDVLEPLAASSCDLRLVASLLEARCIGSLATYGSYLQSVHKKATEEHNEAVLEAVTELLDRYLPTTPPVSG